MQALHSMEPSVSCLEALQIACCDEVSGTDRLRCQSVELCAPDIGVTAVLHRKVCLRVGPEIFAKQNILLEVMSGHLLLAELHLQPCQRKCIQVVFRCLDVFQS